MPSTAELTKQLRHYLNPRVFNFPHAGSRKYSEFSLVEHAFAKLDSVEAVIGAAIYQASIDLRSSVRLFPLEEEAQTASLAAHFITNFREFSSVSTIQSALARVPRLYWCDIAKKQEGALGADFVVFGNPLGRNDPDTRIKIAVFQSKRINQRGKIYVGHSTGNASKARVQFDKYFGPLTEGRPSKPPYLQIHALATIRNRIQLVNRSGGESCFYCALPELDSSETMLPVAVPLQSVLEAYRQKLVGGRRDFYHKVVSGSSVGWRVMQLVRMGGDAAALELRSIEQLVAELFRISPHLKVAIASPSERGARAILRRIGRGTKDRVRIVRAAKPHRSDPFDPEK